jgi:hypothetical protein
MKIHAKLSAVKESRCNELVLRFFFGALITVIAGIIARKFGPAIGGLFLAFPAIFPASATLLEKHQKEKKQSAGIDGTRRARTIAGVDAAGTAMGTLGLGLFALIVWKFLPAYTPWLILVVATIAWFVLSVAIWAACDNLRVFRRHRSRAPSPIRKTHAFRITD